MATPVKKIIIPHGNISGNDTSPVASEVALTRDAANRMGDTAAYLTDAMQRTVLFLDTLLDRGNNYKEHLDQGTPPLLKFAHEVVLDGKNFARPCNYALLCLTPPANMPVDLQKRPVVVVDPRAGHGPGIGGFKFDSEVGMAMRAGHTVYFVTFRPEPEDGQTLVTVMDAEARFIEEVIARHPQCKARPAVIGNCQAGWAMMALNALRPELFGPLMIVGAPVAYWAGSSTLNPMRYAGASLGGSWLASFTADLGVDRFDGVHLVKNFEKLNPANTLWNKYYNLWAGVDTESARFLEFERWWGGYFRMTGSEIESIVENLFVGNRLARRNITAPVVVFASWGDNITPPPQALNWIIDTWGDERAIAAAGRTIIYVLHETVGHLGIFVGGAIALKEHDQLVTSLDVIESLPPGLYEMKLEAKPEGEAQRWDALEPGDYKVHYEYRTMDDLRALNPEGREEEAMFSTIAKVSEFNANLYKTWVRPWVKTVATRQMGDAIGKMHSMRMERALFSDAFPFAPMIRREAEKVRANRMHIADDHPLRLMEKKIAAQISASLDTYRDKRDARTVSVTRKMFGEQGLGAWFKPETPDAEIAQARARQDLDGFRATVVANIAQGGFAEAVCRIVLAGMASTGAFERRSLRLARLLAQAPDGSPGSPGAAGSSGSDGTNAGAKADPNNRVNWIRLLKEQARITAVAPVEALNAIGQMLPNTAARERALALSAAVMMIEPTLTNPRSEIISYLIDSLGVDPKKVIVLARKLTDALAAPTPVTSGPTLKRTTARAKPAAKAKKTD
jgi:hypothetical protein